LDAVGAATGVEGDAGPEGITDSGTEFAEGCEVPTGHSARGFHFERQDRSVVTFDDDVDFVVVVGPPVADAGEPVHPGRLFEELADDEGLEEVAQFGEGAGVASEELVRRQPEQSGRNARVEDVDLGGCRGPGAARPAPGGEPMEQEDGLEKTGVALGGAVVEPGVSGGPLDVEDLGGLAGEAEEELGKKCALADAAEVAYVALQRQRHILVE